MSETQFESGGLGKKFTVILNSALRDSRMSHRARGILCACLSHAENFRFNRDWIVSNGTEGRDAVISALKELRELGYLENTKTRDASGRVTGEFYRFTDRPISRPKPEPERDSAIQGATAENQRPEKPDAGKSGRSRRLIERKPNKPINPPLSPHPESTENCQADSAINLPEWAEPYVGELTHWLVNRAKRHKLQPEIKASTIRGLEYARNQGVLKEYCEYASENSWQSLGFPGHKDVVDKLAKENNKKPSGKSFEPPPMAPIVYTLGV